MSIKTWTVVGSIGVAILCGETAKAQTLVYNFNTTGATQTSTGSDPLAVTTKVGSVATNAVGSPPVGPDGGSSLILTTNSSTMVTQATITSDANFTTGLASFSIGAWVDNYTSSASASRVFYVVGGSVAGTAKTAIDFNLAGSATVAMALSVNGSTGVASNSGGTGTILTVPVGSSTWTFLGVTYDSSTGTVKFYSGALGGTLNSYTSNTLLTNTQVTNSTLLELGNINNGGRQVNGDLDDISFYNSALSGSAMNTLFTSVPEPNSVALLGFGGLTFFGFRAARRRFLARESVA